MNNFFDGDCYISRYCPLVNGCYYFNAYFNSREYCLIGTYCDNGNFELESLFENYTKKDIPITDEVEKMFNEYGLKKLMEEVEIVNDSNEEDYSEYDSEDDYEDEEYDDGTIIEPNIKDLHAEGDVDGFTINSGDTLIAECDIYSIDALPFVIGNGKVYVGEYGDAHPSCNYPDDIRKYEDCAFGRLWFKIELERGFSFPYHILAFWPENNERIIDTKLVEKFFSDYGVDKNKVLVVLWEDIEGEETDCIMPYTEWNFKLARANERQKKARELHLMNAHDKHNATSDFRNTRDRKIGQKLTNDKGVEMPVAQYRSMIYGENKNRLGRIIREVINQYLRKNLLLVS